MSEHERGQLYALQYLIEFFGPGQTTIEDTDLYQELKESENNA